MAGCQDMDFQVTIFKDSAFKDLGFVIARSDDASDTPGPSGGDRVTVQDRIIRIRQESP